MQDCGSRSIFGDYCRGQVVTPASQDSTAVVEGTSTSDVLLLLKTGPDMYLKWKTEGS
jgi:hypothetical protein